MKVSRCLAEGPFQEIQENLLFVIVRDSRLQKVLFCKPKAQKSEIGTLFKQQFCRPNIRIFLKLIWRYHFCITITLNTFHCKRSESTPALNHFWKHRAFKILFQKCQCSTKIHFQMEHPVCYITVRCRI